MIFKTSTLINLLEFFGSIYVVDLPDQSWRDILLQQPHVVAIDVNNEVLSCLQRKQHSFPPPEVYEFLKGIPHLHIRKSYAERLVAFDNWWLGFESIAHRVRILFASEKYSEVNELFLRSSASTPDHEQVRELWFQAVSKLGQYWYSNLIPSPRTTRELLSYLRDCWQRAEFSEAQRVIEHLDASGLDLDDKCRLLNQKIRVDRDLGKMRRSQGALLEFAEALKSMRLSTVAQPGLQDHEAKYNYNLGIDRFISGQLEQCIALSERSLESRIDKYSLPYIYARMVRAASLKGDAIRAEQFLTLTQSLKVDSWGASLVVSVQAEMEFFLRRDAVAAEKLWVRARDMERGTGSLFLYSEVGIGYCAIALADPIRIGCSLSYLRDFELAEAKICTDFLDIASSFYSRLIAGIDIDLNDVWSAHSDYPAWLYYGYVALARGSKHSKLGHHWPPDVSRKFSATDISTQELKELEMAKSPKVFISYSRDSAAHGDWCLRLYKILREHGIDAIIDEAAKGVTTVDFNSFMVNGVRDSNIVLIVLTPNYKQKIENEKGGAHNEFSMLRSEILNRDFKRIVFVLREGDFDSTCPFEARGVEQIDLRADDLRSSSLSEEGKQLLRRVLQIPTIDPVPLGSAAPPKPRSI